MVVIPRGAAVWRWGSAVGKNRTASEPAPARARYPLSNPFATWVICTSLLPA